MREEDHEKPSLVDQPRSFADYIKQPFGPRCIVKEMHRDARHLLHRNAKKGPALIECNGESRDVLIEYYWHGKLHRVGGPASYSVRLDDGSISYECWHQLGQYHRDPREGPAYKIWGRSRNVFTEFAYRLYGYPYREAREGPAQYILNEKGELSWSRYTEEIAPTWPPTYGWLRKTYGTHNQVFSTWPPP
jgi:hypothetical protein